MSPLWVLTAAHCVRKKLFIRLGEHNLEVHDGSEIEFRVELAIKHPKYDKRTVDNDVAMLRYKFLFHFLFRTLNSKPTNNTDCRKRCHHRHT